MAQARGGKGMGRLSGGKVVLLIELKNRILAALNKLSDRDTQQIAVEDLERLTQGLTPDGLALFLTCLYDTDAQQKSVVRRECIKILGTLARLHGDLLSSHLPKMVANIVRRLKDPDSNIRDACVDTIGILASQTGRGIQAGAFLNVFVKPLFEALGEQHRNLQVGASLCLARVLDCTTDPDPTTLQLLCPRIAKLLGSSNFLGRAALLTTIACLSQVKPVRDSVAEALLSWKKIPETSNPQGCPQLPPAAKGKFGKSDSGIPTRSTEQDASTPFLGGLRISSSLLKSGAQVNASFPVSTTRMKSIPERSGSLKKRSPALSTKNPDFFRKLENARNTELGDWQVEVATPQGTSSSGLSPQQGSSTMGDINGGVLEHQKDGIDETPPFANEFGGFVTPNEATYMELRGETDAGRQSTEVAEKRKLTTTRGAGLKKTPLPEQSEDGALWMDLAQPPSDVELNSWDASVPVTSPNSSNGSFADAVASYTATTTTPDWMTVHNQLQNIERQQCSMMGMLQEFMVGVYENMQGLEGRVQKLEQVVDGRAHSASTPVDQLPDYRSPMLGGTSSRSLSELLAVADSLNSKIKKGSSWELMFGERVAEAIFLSGRSREPSWRNGKSGSEQWGEFACGLGSQTGRPSDSPRTEASQQDGLQASYEQDLNTNQVVNRRVSRRGLGPPMQQGEGPSGRSVWKASKDEATLVAIRGAPPDKLSPGQSDTSSEYKSKFQVDYKDEPKTDCKTITGNKHGGDPFWVLWSRALDSVHANDLDAAYLEILGSRDELLLVRMMGHTGPVLQQLASSTALQLVCTITHLLQQQGFLDCILPWIQQVSDLTASNGVDCLELSEVVKKDLVSSLQEASALDFAEGWIGNMVEQLFVQLSSLWSIDDSIPS